jgi:alkanesulfonate monooxygenase SsuD/methylene tetrahydromethanopterin reductase-like flavin-dependent oxidoreductase (luciferase family)
MADYGHELRFGVIPNLASLPLRPPLMLARAAATRDIISGGRFELGLATGAQHSS